MTTLYNILLALGLILFGISIFILRRTFTFLRLSERAEATVIDLNQTKDSDGGYMYKPTFKFITKQKQEIEYRYSFSSNTTSWEIGDKTTVAYDPHSPTDAKILTYFGTFNATIILLAIAIPLIIVGAGYYLTQPYLK